MTKRERHDDPPAANPPAAHDALPNPQVDPHDDAASSVPASDEPIDFMTLAQGRREILLRLAGQTYRLRWTRNDKLILTK